MFNRSVTKYTVSTAVIYFPEGYERCDMCPLLETYARKQCRMTGEYLADTRTIGYQCPLNFKENDNGKLLSGTERDQCE